MMALATRKGTYSPLLDEDEGRFTVGYSDDEGQAVLRNLIFATAQFCAAFSQHVSERAGDVSHNAIGVRSRITRPFPDATVRFAVAPAKDRVGRLKLCNATPFLSSPML